MANDFFVSHSLSKQVKACQVNAEEQAGLEQQKMSV